MQRKPFFVVIDSIEKKFLILLRAIKSFLLDQKKYLALLVAAKDKALIYKVFAVFFYLDTLWVEFFANTSLGVLIYTFSGTALFAVPESGNFGFHYWVLSFIHLYTLSTMFEIYFLLYFPVGRRFFIFLMGEDFIIKYYGSDNGLQKLLKFSGITVTVVTLEILSKIIIFKINVKTLESVLKSNRKFREEHGHKQSFQEALDELRDLEYKYLTTENPGFSTYLFRLFDLYLFKANKEKDK